MAVSKASVQTSARTRCARTAKTKAASFGCGAFYIAEGVDAIDAIEKASELLACVISILSTDAYEQGGAESELASAAHHLAEMAKGLIDSAAAGIVSEVQR